MRDQALIESKVCQRGDRPEIKETWSKAARKAAARKMQPGLSEVGKLTAGPSMPSPGEHSVEEDDDGFHGTRPMSSARQRLERARMACPSTAPRRPRSRAQVAIIPQPEFRRTESRRWRPI
jgi:hypothetical protein